jgi:hypothetical protein
MHASSGGYLSEWFPRAPQHLVVEVDAVGLGTYGRVLSLLVCPDFPDPDELYAAEEEGLSGLEDRDWRSHLRRQAGYGD